MKKSLNKPKICSLKLPQYRIQDKYQFSFKSKQKIWLEIGLSKKPQNYSNKKYPRYPSIDQEKRHYFHIAIMNIVWWKKREFNSTMQLKIYFSSATHRHRIYIFVGYITPTFHWNFVNWNGWNFHLLGSIITNVFDNPPNVKRMLSWNPKKMSMSFLYIYEHILVENFKILGGNNLHWLHIHCEARLYPFYGLLLAN